MDERAARAIIQFPYHGSKGEEVGILLCLQHHPRTGSRSYILPGGTLNKNEDYEEGLRRELKEELNVNPTGLGPYYEYTTEQNRQGRIISRRTRVYYITHVVSDCVKLQEGEIDGVGGFGVGSRRIPIELLEGHVKGLARNFYHNPEFVQYVGRQTEGIPRLTGLITRERSTPNNVIPWNEQRRNWDQWVNEKRGIPPVSRS